MKYPLLILKNELNTVEANYVVKVPDLPGCQIEAESISAGVDKISDVVAEHLSILSEYGEDVPHAKSLDFHVTHCEELNPIWAILDFDIVPYLGKSHKINVTLPELLIKKIDDRVSKSPEYKTRSGFIAASCLAELNKKG